MLDCSPTNTLVIIKTCFHSQVLHKEIQRHKKTVDDVTATGLRIIYEGKPEGLSVRGKLTGIIQILIIEMQMMLFGLEVAQCSGIGLF